jgi:hypothetical protein
MDVKVIYYTLLCHPILRDKPYDMTKRCDFKFFLMMLKAVVPDVQNTLIRSDVEKHRS